MFKRQKDGKMVATEHWVNISSFHNLPFLDDKSVVGPPSPKEAHFKHVFGSVWRVKDLLYKKSLNVHCADRICWHQNSKMESVAHFRCICQSIQGFPWPSFQFLDRRDTSPQFPSSSPFSPKNHDAVNSVSHWPYFPNKKAETSHDWPWGRIFKIGIVHDTLLRSTPSGLRLWVWISSHEICEFGQAASPVSQLSHLYEVGTVTSLTF